MENNDQQPSIMAILGAGASYDLGLPLALEMAEMVCEMLVPADVFSFDDARFEVLQKAERLKPSGISATNYWYNRDLREHEGIRKVLGLTAESQSVVHALCSRLSHMAGGRVDIERLGAAIDWAAALSGLDLAMIEADPTDLSGVRGAIAELGKLVRESVRRLAWLPTKDASLADGLWSILHHVMESPSPTVATLNYDNGVELCLDRKDLQWDYGFDTGWCHHRYLNFREGRLALLKLHGSSNWAVNSDGVVRVINPLALERRFMPREPIGDPAAILFGGGIKMRYAGPFMALHCEFRRRLELHRVVVVAGYSFRDAHINDDLGGWARRDSRRKIVAVNPGDFYDLAGGKTDLVAILNVSAWQVMHIKMPMREAGQDLAAVLRGL